MASVSKKTSWSDVNLIFARKKMGKLFSLLENKQALEHHVIQWQWQQRRRRRQRRRRQRRQTPEKMIGRRKKVVLGAAPKVRCIRFKAKRRRKIWLKAKRWQPTATSATAEATTTTTTTTTTSAPAEAMATTTTGTSRHYNIDGHDDSNRHLQQWQQLTTSFQWQHQEQPALSAVVTNLHWQYQQRLLALSDVTTTGNKPAMTPATFTTCN